MKAILHIAVSKIGKNLKKSVLQSVAVLVSMFAITFFACFIISLVEFKAANPSFGITATDGESILTIDSLTQFFSDIITGIATIACAIIVLSLISFYIYSRLGAEENRQFFATLASIGATKAERVAISVAEALLLYGIPIIIGAILGAIPSNAFMNMVARIFIEDYSLPPLSFIVPLCLAFVGILLVFVFTRSYGSGQRKSVIEQVRSHNAREAGEPHNYRKSYTFRSMPIEQQIAKKSVEYYKSAYRRISFMFASCACYPLLAILFFFILSGTSVTDHTPGYGIDIMGLVDIFARNILLLGIAAFIALSIFSVLQTTYIIKAHNQIRNESLAIYRSVGMTSDSAKRVLKYEYRTAVFHAVIMLIILALLILSCVNGF